MASHTMSAKESRLEHVTISKAVPSMVARKHYAWVVFCCVMFWCQNQANVQFVHKHTVTHTHTHNFTYIHIHSHTHACTHSDTHRPQWHTPFSSKIKLYRAQNQLTGTSKREKCQTHFLLFCQAFLTMKICDFFSLISLPFLQIIYPAFYWWDRHLQLQNGNMALHCMQ